MQTLPYPHYGQVKRRDEDGEWYFIKQYMDIICQKEREVEWNGKILGWQL
jgi:hypothetical protein